MHGPENGIWSNSSNLSISKSYSFLQKRERWKKEKKYLKLGESDAGNTLSLAFQKWKYLKSFSLVFKSFSSVRFVKHNNLCTVQFTEVSCNSHCQMVEFITFLWNISILVKNALLELLHDAVPFHVILGICKQYDPSHSGLVQMFQNIYYALKTKYHQKIHWKIYPWEIFLPWECFSPRTIFSVALQFSATHS